MAESKRQKLEKALNDPDTFEALSAARELVGDDGGGAAGEVLTYVYACVLEANSTGLSTLFDRFEDSELQRIRAALVAVEAVRTLEAFDLFNDAFTKAIAEGKDRLDASEEIAEQPQLRSLNLEYEQHCEEMERKLLEYCRAHIDQLAGAVNR